MATLAEQIQGERMARVALSMIAEPNDLGDRAPYLLWTRGAVSFLTTPLSDQVTITGTRASTGYGEHVTAELAMGIADEESVVVSGGAYGIEGAAQRSALAAGGHTIAVQANGLDRPYPDGHAELLGRIGDVGLLLSEVPPGTTPTKHRFTAHNRLITALSGATVIPEASVRSGSRVTVLEARGLGRGIGAVPGPITSIASSGPNQLIRQGVASLIIESGDVLALLDKDSRAQARPMPDLSPRPSFSSTRRDHFSI